MQISGSTSLTENIIHIRWLYNVLSLQAEFSITRPLSLPGQQLTSPLCVAISAPYAPCYLFELSTLSPSRSLLVSPPFEVYLQSGSSLIQMKLFRAKGPS